MSWRRQYQLLVGGLFVLLQIEIFLIIISKLNFPSLHHSDSEKLFRTIEFSSSEFPIYTVFPLCGNNDGGTCQHIHNHRRFYRTLSLCHRPSVPAISMGLLFFGRSFVCFSSNRFSRIITIRKSFCIILHKRVQ